MVRCGDFPNADLRVERRNPLLCVQRVSVVLVAEFLDHSDAMDTEAHGGGRVVPNVILGFVFGCLRAWGAGVFLVGMGFGFFLAFFWGEVFFFL